MESEIDKYYNRFTPEPHELKEMEELSEMSETHLKPSFQPVFNDLLTAVANNDFRSVESAIQDIQRKSDMFLGM